MEPNPPAEPAAAFLSGVPGAGISGAPGAGVRPEPGALEAAPSDEAQSEPGDSVRWQALLRETRTRLARAGVESPAAEARHIVGSAAGTEEAGLASMLDRPATARAVARLDAMVAARSEGRPLQYVLGRWGFRTLDLLVDPRVLIPRPETEAVAGWAIAEIASQSDRGEATVVDLGTGSGAIALSVAVECPRARVHASDVSAEALAVARANLAGAGRAAARVTLHEGDWFDALPGELRGRVDVVVSNPPYVADGDELPSVVADWEPELALRAGPDGLDAVVRVIDGAAAWLRPGGTLVVEMAPRQTGPMAERARRAGFSPVRVEQDLAGRDRAVIARRP